MSRARHGRFLGVGLVQMSMRADPDENAARAEEGIREAAAQGARLVCLPELYRSRYFCQTPDAANFDLAEAVPGPSTGRLAALATELDIAIVAGLFERRAAGLYHNTAVVIDPERGFIGKYRKMHIPDDPRYHEKFHFAPGDLGFASHRTASAELGVLVCWDQWFPEAARMTALKGAEILVYPTAIGWHPEEREEAGERQLSAWETVQRGHAIVNGCFVVAVNRVGFEPEPEPGGRAGLEAASRGGAESKSDGGAGLEADCRERMESESHGGAGLEAAIRRGMEPESDSGAGVEATNREGIESESGGGIKAANRAGTEPERDGDAGINAANRRRLQSQPVCGGGIEFWGRSFIAAPDGRVIARAPHDSEAVLVERIDLGEIESNRRAWPFFRDRRIDAYDGLLTRFSGADEG